MNNELFITIFNKYKNNVYNSVWFILKSDSYAEDITQEVFVQVYRNLGKLRNPEKLEAWLYRITFNSCLQHISKEKKVKTEDINLENIQEDKEINIPEIKVLNDDFRNELLKAIYDLPEHHRIPIILFYYLNKSIKEIAKIIKCPEGTVKSRLSISRNTLKNKISRILITEKSSG